MRFYQVHLSKHLGHFSIEVHIELGKIGVG